MEHLLYCGNSVARDIALMSRKWNFLTRPIVFWIRVDCPFYFFKIYFQIIIAWNLIRLRIEIDPLMFNLFKWTWSFCSYSIRI